MLMRDVGALLVPEGDTVVPLGAAPRLRRPPGRAAARLLGSRTRWAASPLWRSVSGSSTPPTCPANAGRRSARTHRRRRRRVANPPRAGPVPGGHRPAHEDRPGLTGPWPPRRPPSCTGTGRWATSAATPGADDPPRLGLPRAGPACWDLCWYLALNRARLPETKEAPSSASRPSSRRAGIATAAGSRPSSTCASSASWPPSAGRRPWVTRRSSAGGSGG